MSVEELAVLLFELVGKRFSTKEIVSELINTATSIITLQDTNRLEGLVSEYKRDRKNLEGIARELHKVLVGFPNPLNLNSLRWPKFGD